MVDYPPSDLLVKKISQNECLFWFLMLLKEKKTPSKKKKKSKTYLKYKIDHVMLQKCTSYYANWSRETVIHPCPLLIAEVPPTNKPTLEPNSTLLLVVVRIIRIGHF